MNDIPLCERTCSGCAAPITSQSTTGHCRLCALRIANADPAVQARRAERSRERMRDPAYRQKVAAQVRASHEAWRHSPEGAEKLSELGRINIARAFTPEARAKWWANRPRANARRTATMIPWCPPEYLEEYRRLRRSGSHTAETAKRAILVRIEADRLNALATYDNLISAADYLRRYTPVFKRGDGYLYGTAELTPQQLIKRALDKGWQPPFARAA